MARRRLRPKRSLGESTSREPQQSAEGHLPSEWKEDCEVRILDNEAGHGTVKAPARPIENILRKRNV